MNKQILLKILTKMNHDLFKKNKGIDSSITYNNSLFILDWDDTLFPTSWVTKNGIDIINTSSRNDYVEHFKTLDRALSSFLKNVKRFGTVIIVTNAMKDWVKLSSIVLPETSHILKSINIISARSLIGDYTKDVMEWKKQTFQIIVNEEFHGKKIMNVISIGDAIYEYNALVSLTQTHFDKIKYLKTFKLIKDPSYDQLIEEIEVLDKYIHKFANQNKQLCKTFKFDNKEEEEEE
jgi:hypothetical protein